MFELSFSWAFAIFLMISLVQCSVTLACYLSPKQLFPKRLFAFILLINILSYFNGKNHNIKKNPRKKHIGGKLLDISLGNDFLDLISKANATEAKLNKWGSAPPLTNHVNPSTSLNSSFHCPAVDCRDRH